jgi:hypothetical protein
MLKQEMVMSLDFNDPAVWITALVIVLVIVVGIVLLVATRRKRKTAELRRRFGSEYDLCLREDGSRRKAEARLLARVRRMERLKIRSLTPAELDRYRADWEMLQSRFVDHPRAAVTEADDLVIALMQTRGFPVGDFDQRAADLSVDHARLVQSYRSANAIILRVGANQSTTEELRTAMIHYRAMLDELLEVKTSIEQRTLV